MTYLSDDVIAEEGGYVRNALRRIYPQTDSVETAVHKEVPRYKDKFLIGICYTNKVFQQIVYISEEHKCMGKWLIVTRRT